MRSLFVSLALALATLAAPAQSQTYPSRPVTITVPYAAGGSVDAIARVVSARLTERMKQSFVIDNVAGAGGVIGTAKAAGAAPSGYSLLFSVESTMAIAKLVQPASVTYDSQKDFMPITLIGTSPLVLVGRNTLPAKNAEELLKLLRAEPGKYNYATSGIGTSLHVAGEMINQLGKVSMTHVPYRVGAQMVTDLTGNNMDLAMLPLIMALPNARAGTIRAFGTTEPTRTPVAPDLPSLSETPELTGVDVTVWFGLFAPAKTDPAIVNQLHGEIAAALAEPDTRTKLSEMGLRVVGSGPAAFASFLDNEIKKFTEVVKAANIKVE